VDETASPPPFAPLSHSHTLDIWSTFLESAGVALRNAWPLALIGLTIALPMAAVVTLGCPTLLNYMFRSPASAPTTFEIPSSEWLVLAGAVLLAIGFGSWAYTAVCVYTDAVLAGEPKPGVRAAFGRGLERVPSFLLTYMGLLGLVFFGVFFCLLPGIWISIALHVAPVRSVTAGRSAGDAIRETFALTRRRWWRVFGYTLLVGLAIQVVYLPLSMPMMFLGRPLGAAGIILMGVLITVSTLLGTFQQACMVGLHRRLEELGPVGAPAPASA
jgi:hypothetical protein